VCAALAAAHLGVLWQEPAILGEAETLVERLPTLIEQDAHFDLIGGAAGYIGGLLALQQAAPSSRTRAAAIQCGDHLLAQARPQSRGIGWVSPIATQPSSTTSTTRAGAVDCRSASSRPV
jgi:lantibiotic modifying enzyme